MRERQAARQRQACSKIQTGKHIDRGGSDRYVQAGNEINIGTLRTDKIFRSNQMVSKNTGPLREARGWGEGGEQKLPKNVR